jgi:MFS family permease
MHSIWQFYVLYGLIIATGLCGFWVPPVSTVAHWFIGRRGLMTGIVGGGISMGTLIMAPAVTQLIVVYGWRMTYVIMGVAILVIAMIAAQFLKQGPHEMGLTAYGETKIKPRISGVSDRVSLKEALRTRPFWIVCIIYFCFGLAHLTIMVHIVPEALGIGISPIHAAVILSIIGIIGLLGRITLGSVTDRLQVKGTTIISLVLLTVSLIWLQQAGNLWKLYVFAVVFGFGYGGLSCVQSLLAVELFGLSTVGVITAIFSFSFNVGGAVGPVLAGYIFDVNGSYQWAFLICLISIALALLISLSLKPSKKA